MFLYYQEGARIRASGILTRMKYGSAMKGHYKEKYKKNGGV